MKKDPKKGYADGGPTGGFDEPHYIPNPSNPTKTIPNPKYYQADPKNPAVFSLTPLAETLYSKAGLSKQAGGYGYNQPKYTNGAGQSMGDLPNDYLENLGFGKDASGVTRNPAGAVYHGNIYQEKPTAQPINNHTFMGQSANIPKDDKRTISRFENPNFTNIPPDQRKQVLQDVFSQNYKKKFSNDEEFNENFEKYYSNLNKNHNYVYKEPQLKTGGLVKKLASGGWVDNNGQPVDENDVNFKMYSDEDRKNLGYKQVNNNSVTNSALGSTALNLANSLVNNSSVQQNSSSPSGINAQSNLGKEKQKEQQNDSKGKALYGAGYGLAGKLGNPLVAAGASAATIGTDALGNSLQNKYGVNTVKGEVAGDTVRDAGKGGALGATIGSNPELIAATGGLSVPIGIGAGILLGGTEGAIRGNIQGKKKVAAKNKDLSGSTEANALANQYNPSSINQTYGTTPNTTNFAGGGLIKMCADGGKITGKGTSKSDSINAKVKSGSFVVPAENSEVAEELKEKVIGVNSKKKANLKQKGGQDVKLSDGEVLFSPEEVKMLEAKGIDINALAPDAKQEYQKHFASGGTVDDFENDGSGVRDLPAALEGESSNDYKARVKKIKAAKSQSYTDYAKNIPVNEGENRKQYFDRVKKLQADELQNLYAKPVKSNSNTSVSKQSGATPSGQSLADKLAYSPMDSKAVNKIPGEKLSDISGIKDLYKPTKEDKSGYLQNKYGIDKKVADDAVSGVQRNNVAQDKYPDLGSIFGLGQAAVGAGILLNKGNKRPVYDTTPEFKSQLAKTIALSNYGYSPEQKALLNNNAIENRNAGLANVRNLSGSDAGTALVNSRAVFNDYNQNKLKTASDDEMLRLQKNSAANNMSIQNEGYNREKYNDSYNKFVQNQGAASNLLGAGISNIIDSGRYSDYKRSQAQLDRIDALGS